MKPTIQREKVSKESPAEILRGLGGADNIARIAARLTRAPALHKNGLPSGDTHRSPALTQNGAQSTPKDASPHSDRNIKLEREKISAWLKTVEFQGRRVLPKDIESTAQRIHDKWQSAYLAAKDKPTTGHKYDILFPLFEVLRITSNYPWPLYDSLCAALQ